MVFRWINWQDPSQDPHLYQPILEYERGMREMYYDGVGKCMVLILVLPSESNAASTILARLSLSFYGRRRGSFEVGAIVSGI